MQIDFLLLPLRPASHGSTTLSLRRLAALCRAPRCVCHSFAPKGDASAGSRLAVLHTLHSSDRLLMRDTASHPAHHAFIGALTH
jgi:hypothetical protein